MTTMDLNQIGIIKTTFDGPIPSMDTYVDIPGLKIGDIVLTVLSIAHQPMFGAGVTSCEAVISEDDKLHLSAGSFNGTGTFTAILVRI